MVGEILMLASPIEIAEDTDFTDFVNSLESVLRQSR